MLSLVIIYLAYHTANLSCASTDKYGAIQSLAAPKFGACTELSAELWRLLSTSLIDVDKLSPDLDSSDS
jgi:hypothetical protein